MRVNERGQVTIPEHIRAAAGVVPGSEVSFSLEGDRIGITRLATSAPSDRRATFRAAAARVRSSLSPEFRKLSADEIMAFLREAAQVRDFKGRGGNQPAKSDGEPRSCP
jgi:antitoxin PrlF